LLLNGYYDARVARSLKDEFQRARAKQSLTMSEAV